MIEQIQLYFFKWWAWQSLHLQQLWTLAWAKKWHGIGVAHIAALVSIWLVWRFVAAPILARVVLYLRFGARARGKRSFYGRIIRVVDGDTVDVRRGITGFFWVVRVRMLYIDTPEKAQRHGEKARFFLWQHGRGKTVLLVCAANKDRYGRELAEIYCTHLRDSLNLTLVKHGWAWAYKGTKHYDVAQSTAKRKRVGVWRDRNPINPSEWRKGAKS